MYKIGICDDDIIYVDNIVREINLFFKDHNQIEIVNFNNPFQVLHNYQQIDILFLDIEMPKFSGIELKNKLEILGYPGYIIYITNYEEYMYEAFGKNVVAYISKSNLKKIHETLEKIINNESRNKSIRIGNMELKLNQIEFLQSDRGYIYIHTNKGVEYYCIYLKDLLQRINSNLFIQIHRSYVVNLTYVKSFTSQFVILLNDKEIPLSRTYKKQFKIRFYKYLKEN